MADPFWIQNPSLLIDKDRLVEFVPNKGMTTNERLNAITRFFLYLSVLLTVIYRNVSMIYIFLIASFILYLIKEHYPVKDKEGFVGDSTEEKTANFQMPTKNNPFMNVLIGDYVDDPGRKPAADVEDPDVKEAVNRNFSKGLYRDIDNVWDRNNSQRQYYTMPSTTIPNDRDSFMNWCYKTPNTCKDGNLQRCLQYEDVRQHGQIK